MVLLNSEARGDKNGQNEFIFWLSHNYDCAFFSSIYNYNIDFHLSFFIFQFLKKQKLNIDFHFSFFYV